MPGTVFGLPAHPLVVHVTVVFVPLAAVLVLLAALWPAARRRIGLWAPIVAVIALVLVPLTSSSGEDLQERVPETALVRQHTHMGDSLLPWVFGMAVAAVALVLLTRRLPWLARLADADRRTAASRPVPGWLSGLAARVEAVADAAGRPAAGAEPGRTTVLDGGPSGRTAVATAPAGVTTTAAAAPRPARARWVLWLVLAVAVLTAVGSLVQVVRIGDSGARAAWDKAAVTTPTGEHDD